MPIHQILYQPNSETVSKKGSQKIRKQRERVEKSEEVEVGDVTKW